MCSDGLSNMVEDEKIQEIISDPEADIDQKGSAAPSGSKSEWW